MTQATVPLRALETLWIQITGTICNIKCQHCFISCSPTNDHLSMMTREEISQHVSDARELGTTEYYMTGGEPFLHEDIEAIVEDILCAGPLTILTNATLIDCDRAERLLDIQRRQSHDLTFRVSLDGPDALRNDAIRGKGVFARTSAGVGLLAERGFHPIMTMMRSWDESEDESVQATLREHLAAVGYPEARIKLLPILRLGAETTRSRGYSSAESVTASCIANHDLETLLCHTARIVSADGVHVCPILVGEKGSIVGNRLTRLPGAFRLNHSACFTCVVSGTICNNENSR